MQSQNLIAYIYQMTGTAAVTTDKQLYKVFISSTYLDNEKRRKWVEDAVLRADMQPFGMEWFTASGRPTPEECEKVARECDVYVGIVAYRYGWIPEGSDRSITEIEYDAARNAGRPCLMFEIDRSILMDREKDTDEGPDRWKKQDLLDRFKAKYHGHQMPKPFTDETLGTLVLHALNKWWQSISVADPRSPITGPRRLCRPEEWAIAAMIDKTDQSECIVDKDRADRPLAYFLMGHQIEWPWALAYRLAVRLVIEDISKNYVKPRFLHVGVPTTPNATYIKRSLCAALSGNLLARTDELQEALRRNKSNRLLLHSPSRSRR